MPVGLAHYDQWSPFAVTSPAHLHLQPKYDQPGSLDVALFIPRPDDSGAARQLSTTWQQCSALWPSSVSAHESPEQSPQRMHSGMQQQRSSGGSSPTAVSVGAAATAIPVSSGAPYTAYNMQQPSVGFYRRESVSSMGPAASVLGRPDHVPDAAGFNVNKSITKRLANATHYQQVLDIIADSASCFDEVRYPVHVRW